MIFGLRSLLQAVALNGKNHWVELWMKNSIILKRDLLHEHWNGTKAALPQPRVTSGLVIKGYRSSFTVGLQPLEQD